jgi:ribonucleoside-diphosphate reductase alpha chain
VYLRTGEFADGRLGEIFLTISRDGSTINHMAAGMAITMSLGLQHGVPLQEYVDAFTDARAEPSGLVQGSDKVRMCTSIMDYVVRELAAHYLHLETNIPVVVQSPEPTGKPEVILSSTRAPSAEMEAISSGALTAFVVGDRPGESIMPLERDDGDALRQAAGMRTMARPKYNGQACPSCHNFTLRRSGTCHVCDTCGSTTGCS